MLHDHISCCIGTSLRLDRHLSRHNRVNVAFLILPLLPPGLVCPVPISIRLWWAYPFFPYADVWLDTFYRLEGMERRTHLLSLTLRRLTKAIDVVDEENEKGERPRWDGAFEEMGWGLAPLAVVIIVWQACSLWRLICVTIIWLKSILSNANRIRNPSEFPNPSRGCVSFVASY